MTCLSMALEESQKTMYIFFCFSQVWKFQKFPEWPFRNFKQFFCDERIWPLCSVDSVSVQWENNKDKLYRFD